MSARFPSFDPTALDAEAKSVHERILNERGYVPGPYQFWLASPGFADRIEPVEKFLRYEVALAERQVEIIVLLVAKHWRSQYVWSSHAPAAIKAGVRQQVVDAIRRDETPEFDSEQDLICFELCMRLLANDGVDDGLWECAENVLGARRSNEIMGLLGLYTSVCLTMVAYQMPPKDGAQNPFSETF